MALSIRPMQWANLPELHQTPVLDAGDLDCLEEIRDVLTRHRRLARFAVHLAHRHFELAPGEILIERPDPGGRTQHVAVGRLNDEPEARPTTWLFEESPECGCQTRRPLSSPQRDTPLPHSRGVTF